MIKNIFKEIHQRGHRIGIHGSYHTYKNPAAFSEELSKLKRVLSSLNIPLETIYSRQHYLRWDPKVTPALMSDCGVDYDSTLGYAEVAGFRNGTAHSFNLYDFSSRTPFDFQVEPLIVMEGTVIEPLYMGLGKGEESYKMMHSLKDKCAEFGGCFTLLWHNSSLSTPEDKKLYDSLLK